MELPINSAYKIAADSKSEEWALIDISAGEPICYSEDLSMVVLKLKNRLLRESSGTTIGEANTALSAVNALLESKIPAEILVRADSISV